MIEVHTASFRCTRGYALLRALLDELAFWPGDDSAEPDYEVLSALRPGMATIPGAMLLCASSPYARRGALFDAHRKHFGKDGDPVLVWHAPTRDMNPTVPQRVIDEATERDPASAAAEYGAKFRSDVESFVNREAVEACVSVGVRERPPISGVTYSAFVDPSGGSADSMTLAIGHQEDDVAVLDAIRERRPPFSPEDVVREFAALLKSYRITKCTAIATLASGHANASASTASPMRRPRNQSRTFIEIYCPQSIREWSICSKTRDCLRRSLALSVVLHEAAATASTMHRARMMILPMPSRVSSRRSPLLIPTTRR